MRQNVSVETSTSAAQDPAAPYLKSSKQCFYVEAASDDWRLRPEGEWGMPALALGENGSAPVLAVFTIFVILSCALAISSFQGSDQRSVSATQQLAATDVTRATASTIEGELNQTLTTAVTAAMHDAGIAGGNRGAVEQLTLDYLNRRISSGWSYPNLSVIMPKISAGDLAFEWQPDGSVKVEGYIDAEIRHVYGPTAHGIKLDTSVNPRFLRLRSVALELLANDSGTVEPDRYAAEGLGVEVRKDSGSVTAVVTDVFASPVAMVGGGMDYIRYIASKVIASQPARAALPSPSPQPSGNPTVAVSPSNVSPSNRVAAQAGTIPTGTVTITPSGPYLPILPVYDGGSSPKDWRGGYVLPYTFLPNGAHTFSWPSDPELAKLFGVPGYIDPSTGEVKPLLMDELSINWLNVDRD